MNLGINIDDQNTNSSTGGAFNFVIPGNLATNVIPPGMAFADFTDGTSNTAMWAEIKRGENSIAGNYKGNPLKPWHVRYLNTSWSDWGGTPSSANPVVPGLLVPPASCGSFITAAYYAGDAYYRDEPGFTSNYVHTAVPNSQVGDSHRPQQRLPRGRAKLAPRRGQRRLRRWQRPLHQGQHRTDRLEGPRDAVAGAR